MKEVQLIKQWQSQLHTLEAAAEAAKTELGIAQRKYSSILSEIKSIKSKIENINKTNSLKVSEHAVLRYLERVKGIDISQVEKDILSDKVITLVEQLGGTGKYPNDGFHVVLKNNTVVTIEN